MGSSAKKKKEKKKDFQKQKLKVGKARPKADNHTDTSFRAKAIVLNQQLDVNAPSQSAAFLHHVSMLTARSDSQRRDSLAYLTSHISSTVAAASKKPTGTNTTGRLPITTNALLGSLCPLILDGSAGVRQQLLKLFQTLPAEDIRDHVAKILPYMRAAMTHLSRDIRATAIEFLSFLIKTAGLELVACPGGWYQTLECFTTVLGWRGPRAADAKNWSSTNASFGGGDAKATARIMQVLAEFLQVGLGSDDDDDDDDGSGAGGNNATGVSVSDLAVNFPLWFTNSLMMPSKSNAYAYLDLFGAPQKEKTEDDVAQQILDDPEDRLQLFINKFQPVVVVGVDAAKKEGGELGRASGLLAKTLEQVQQRHGNLGNV
ncbi:Pre-rRNA-processing protein ipi1 [Exophiala dermatitidis]